eukprot:scaffold27730_cov42-Prasinocladus_malaysianus.AAC.1
MDPRGLQLRLQLALDELEGAKLACEDHHVVAGVPLGVPEDPRHARLEILPEGAVPGRQRLLAGQRSGLGSGCCSLNVRLRHRQLPLQGRRLLLGLQVNHTSSSRPLDFTHTYN